MRYIKLINEFHRYKNIDEIVNILEKDCKPFIELYKGTPDMSFLLRGVDYYAHKRIGEVIDGLRIAYNGSKPPRDSVPEFVSKIDDEFEKVFDERLREKSLFTACDINFAGEYGDVYIVIPIGYFDYYWSPKVIDLYNKIRFEHWYRVLYGNNLGYYDYKYGEPLDDGMKSGVYKYEGEELPRDLNRAEALLYIRNYEDYDESKLVWVPDLSREEYIKEIEYDEEDFIKSIVPSYYKNENIEDVITEEVMIVCDEYYLIELEYGDDLIKALT